jgi:hypothetical protein
MNLKINNEVVFRWLGDERNGIIVDIVSDDNKKDKKLYKIKSQDTIYIVGLSKEETRFGWILKEKTEKFQRGDYIIMNKKQDSPIDIKMEELEFLFKDIKKLHNSNRNVELRKKIVSMKKKLAEYKKLTLEA